ncbi:hypothetical protein BDR26DRAFT_852444 [Obelidium mucronatum]|nr:hypothetical protein BDR26DRAFT_852444 [Obelidium mucronatum]
MNKSMFPTADASTTLPPRKKPGRKKADVPAEKKVLLNRLVALELFSTIKTLTGPNNSEAQRQCRDRKARYLSDLESENAMLKQRIKELESKTCSFCETQEVKTEQYLSRIRDLENLVSVKSNQRNDDLDSIVSHHVVSPSTQIYRSAMDTSDCLETETITSEEWIDVQPNNAPKSSVELFGPVDTEYTRSALNSLASIKDNPNIDAMINFFVLQASTTDRRLSIKYLVGLITVRYKLLDACTLLDRHMAHVDFIPSSNDSAFKS